MAQNFDHVTAEEDVALLEPVPVLCIQPVPQFLLVSEAVEQQQHPDNRFYLPAVQRLYVALPLPKAPDWSHSTAHIPEWVYLWTWTEQKKNKKNGFLLSFVKKTII